MKCTKCGAEINENSKFCVNCGTPVMTQTVGMQPNEPINNFQQPTPMPNTYVTNNVPNGKKTPWGLIVGSAILAIVIIAVFVGISMSKEEDNKTNNDNQVVDTEKDKQEEDTPTEESETVTYSDFSFTIPSGFNATSSSSQLLITNDENTLASAIIYQTGTSYDTLVSMKDQVINVLKSQETSQSEGYDFTNAITEEMTFDGTHFLVTSGVKQGTIDLDITYAEAKDGVFVVSIAKTSGNITDSERETLYSIVASSNHGSL